MGGSIYDGVILPSICDIWLKFIVVADKAQVFAVLMWCRTKALALQLLGWG